MLNHAVSDFVWAILTNLWAAVKTCGTSSLQFEEAFDEHSGSSQRVMQGLEAEDQLNDEDDDEENTEPKFGMFSLKQASCFQNGREGT